MATGFADAFLESVFQGRKENADRQKFNANLQFEQAKSAQQNQIEQQRMQNEQQYQQALIQDAQQRNQREGQQYQQSQDWAKTMAGFNAQSQGLATPVQPDVNTRAAGLPLQQAPQGGIPTPAPGGGMIPQIGPRPQAGPLGPPPPSVGPPVMNDQGQPAMQAGALPATMPDRAGAVVQAPPGATQFGDAGYLRPRTVEERQASEFKTKLDQTQAENETKAKAYDSYLDAAGVDPATKQKLGILTRFALSQGREPNAAEVQAILGKSKTTPAKSPDLNDYIEMKNTGKSSSGFYPDLDAPTITKLGQAGFDSYKQSQPKPTNDNATLNRNYRSFKDTERALDTYDKPIREAYDNASKLNTELNQGGEVGQAVAPLQLIQMVKGGSRGMSPKLAEDIIGDRTMWESLSVAESKASASGQRIVLSPQQVTASKKLAAGLVTRLKPQRDALVKAYNNLSPDDDPVTHSKILKSVQATAPEFAEDNITPPATGGPGLDVSKIRGILDKK